MTAYCATIFTIQACYQALQISASLFEIRVQVPDIIFPNTAAVKSLHTVMALLR